MTAPVGLGAIGEGRFGIMVEIHVNLPSIADRAVAEDLVEEADQRCPYSNAVRGKVPVVITVD